MTRHPRMGAAQQLWRVGHPIDEPSGVAYPFGVLKGWAALFLTGAGFGLRLNPAIPQIPLDLNLFSALLLSAFCSGPITPFPSVTYSGIDKIVIL